MVYLYIAYPKILMASLIKFKISVRTYNLVFFKFHIYSVLNASLYGPMQCEYNIFFFWKYVNKQNYLLHPTQAKPNITSAMLAPFLNRLCHCHCNFCWIIPPKKPRTNWREKSGVGLLSVFYSLASGAWSVAYLWYCKLLEQLRTPAEVAIN